MSDIDEKCRKCAGSNTDTASDRMVQCDNCDAWYHFECVGVDSNVANISWNCEFCASNMVVTTTSAAAPPAANVTEFYAPQQVSSIPQSSSSPTQPLFKEPYDFAIPEFTTAPSVYVSTATFTNSTPSTENWKSAEAGKLPGSTIYIATSAHGQPVPLTQSSSSVEAGKLPTSIISMAANTHGQPIPIFTQPISSFRPQSSNACVQPFFDPRYQLPVYSGSMSSAYQMSYRPQIFPATYCSTAATLPYTHEPLTANPTSTQLITMPNPAQLAARQAIPKDLPEFSGDPEEWPIFISSFDSSTTIAGYSHTENLIRLQRCLKGKAREMVKHKLFLPNMVPEIIKTLRMCFGRPEHILDRVLEKVRRLPPPKDRLESLIEFALCVSDICSTMEACQMQAHLHNPMLVHELVSKLPNQHKLNWAMYPKDERVPTVKAFSEWIYQLAQAASTVVPAVSIKKSASLNTHTTRDDNEQRKVSCSVCGDSHKVPQCDKFKTSSISERWETVKAKKLCRMCLNIHRRKCFVAKECGIDGCKSKHHPLLHGTRDNQNMISAHTKENDREQVYFRIVPIKIHTKKGSLSTFAFLDEGSSVTLMDEHIFNALEMNGPKEPICLRWTSDTTRTEEASHKLTVEISGENNVRYKLENVHTVRKLGLPGQTIDMSDVQNKYEHLRGISLTSYRKAKPGILIGADNWNLAVPLKIREGVTNQPIAVKCRLGWALQGGAGSQRRAQLNIHTCDCERQLSELHETVKQQFDMETSTPRVLQSKEDSRAMNILRDTCVLKDGHFEVGLLWRKDTTKLPASYTTAYNRFMCLQRKFKRDQTLKKKFQEQIDNLVSKGYATKLSPEDMITNSGRTWYLPIFTTMNPNKPGKVRLVWDAAAKSNGFSLNDFILNGPDLLNSLVDILIGFRTGRVAICGDIAEMFHQINVNRNDMHVQRFLWADENDDSRKPSVYVMRALTFGIACAPCIAHYVRDKNAEPFMAKYPRAVASIQKYHYVDDLIDCVDNEREAIELAKAVKEIHAAAGFNIRNWTSNSKAVLSQLNGDLEKLPGSATQPVLELSTTEKVLGMRWNPNIDAFQYKLRFPRLERDVFSSDVTVTKRETLQVLMSIFDPLGLLSCFTVELKILLQDIWRSGIGWDQELTPDLDAKWSPWKSTISAISSIEIPRCYSSGLMESSNIQLHIFADAGENAYAAACYLRTTLNSSTETVLVVAKSKVAPLRPVSIPRLELQGAIIGVRMANKVIKVLKERLISISSVFYWSDSKTVLKWLRMDPKHFKPYVMHRVGEILESTNITQWKYVPSKINPADYATKITTLSNARIQSWFHGPEFLIDENQWPTCDDLGSADVSEMRHVLHITKGVLRTVPLNVEYFSDWKRLYRAVATFFLYIDRLKTNKLANRLAAISFDMIENEYQREVSFLKDGKTLEKNSKLIASNVVLDQNDVIRIRSRAEQINSYGGPIVLPKGHHVTILIVRYFYERFHHISHETVINNIRSRYYIPRLRVLYRAVRRICQRCKNNYAAPDFPQMAPLPAARLAAFERPFTYVGIDYFGPLYVTVGRRREKRWGVIFTCLTVRAVHIEVAHSLDTSSCIMCIGNFISRRGTPREIYTDNGTNFKATEKILKDEAKNIDYSELYCKYDEIKWKFNPPAAPHMGGVWERLVRSIKTTLSSIGCDGFNDESLRSALCEVEFIINSRPLTFVSLESCDDEALTPNHLLLGSSSGYKPLCNNGGDLRLRWQQTKAFADKFWHRWVAEYTPILARRSKWFTKRPPIKVGDIVVVVDDNLPRNSWPKGRVIETITAKDGQVRRATIKTQNSVMQRPTTKIAVLDVGDMGKVSRTPLSYEGGNVTAI